MARAYYNELDPYAAAWLRNLIAAGLIAPGDVDERSITDVRPSDLAGYTQAHFFAGIGGWSLAARLAGWPDDRPLWTGSCPCQPFSVAGKGEAQSDERHLWPIFFGLIRATRPPVVMGEQVAAAVGKDWLDGVCADLEGVGYACGAAVVPACAVDAPHRRDRLWFVADADAPRPFPSAHAGIHRGEKGAGPRHVEPVGHRVAGDAWSLALADAEGPGTGLEAGDPPHEGRRSAAGRAEGIRPGDGHSPDLGLGAGGGGDLALADAGLGRRSGPGEGQGELARGAEAVRASAGDVADRHMPLDARQRSVGRPPEGAPEELASGRGRPRLGDMGDASCAGLQVPEREVPSGPRGWVEGGATPEPGRASSAWAGAGWLVGADGKARRFEPGIRLLAHGVLARVGRLRAYGNAIVPQVAAEVIAAYLDAEADRRRVRLNEDVFA